MPPETAPALLTRMPADPAMMRPVSVMVPEKFATATGEAGVPAPATAMPKAPAEIVPALMMLPAKEA